jgi:hypothetical protein
VVPTDFNLWDPNSWGGALYKKWASSFPAPDIFGPRYYELNWKKWLPHEK